MSEIIAGSRADRQLAGARRLLEHLGEVLQAELAVRLWNGERVPLSAKEYDLLIALAEEPDRVYRKDELLRDVWGFRSLGRTRTLDSHASRLRRKLNPNGEQAYVLNVWGVGYQLVAPA